MSEKKVVMVTGDPGNGKSYCAKTLRREYGFFRISTDRLYVDFIHDRFPELYFPAIRALIAPHYHHIFSPDVYGDEVEVTWRMHMVNAVEQALLCHNKVVVEGYLLFAMQAEDYEKLKSVARVQAVKAHNKNYLVDGKDVTIEELAHL